MGTRRLNCFVGVSSLLALMFTLMPECQAQNSTQSDVESTSREDTSVNNPVAPSRDSTSQTTFYDPNQGSPNYDTSLGLGLIKRLSQDQIQLWTSPARLTWADLDLLVPFGMATGTLLYTDTDTSKNMSNSPSRLHDSLTFSNYGLGAMVGLGAGFYAWGQLTHDPHKKETGFLASEAALNAFLVTNALGYGLGRERPLQSPLYQGDFWHGGTSMPSDHAAISWAIASVVAHEYPGKLTQFLAYGLASAIGFSRVTAKQHFPSDVFVGSAIGWYTGKQVFRAHHDPELDGDDWQSYGEFKNGAPNERTTSLGTTYVPLDSWIYPALERLIALGYIKGSFMGIRPWSRFECAKLVLEAGDSIAAAAYPTQEVQDLYSLLSVEFAQDSDRLGGGRPTDSSARLESVYSRITGIEGPPLIDGYHFGETLYDDFGRPYAEGVNLVSGTSGWVTRGRFAFYFRGEYQYAPSSPTYSSAVNNAIATMDANPVQPGTFPSTSRFQLLDTYVSSTQSNWMFSFGKQSLWWGPDYGGDLILSDNAAPMLMFRVKRIAPFVVPGISRVLGPMTVDFFYGKLDGNLFPAGAQIHGEKFSFKPLPGLEVGWDRTVELGGTGQPLTLHRIFESYVSYTTVSPFVNPGKRTGGFDFTWQLPYFLRNWLTFYANSLATDNVSPVADMTRAGLNPGIYLSHFPVVSKLDLRLEAVYTDTPDGPPSPRGQFIYWNTIYHDLYMNEGNLIGDWIGRQGNGYQAWSTYHVNSRNWIQIGYRHTNVSPDFVPHGGTLSDASVSVNWWLKRDLNATGLLQYERWFYPLLAPGPQTNWTSSVGLTFYPHGLSLPSHPGQQDGN